MTSRTGEPDWRTSSLCAQINGEMFFTSDDGAQGNARRICHKCPVRLECLTDALTRHPEYGIFGGFGRYARQVMVVQVNAGKPAKKVAAYAIAVETAKRRAINARAR